MDASEDAGRWAGCHGDVFALDSDEDRERALAEIGRPSQVTAAAKLDALPAWSRWQDSLLAYLDTGDSPADAPRLLAQWSQEVAEDEAIAASIYSARMQARMAGQLFVRTVEVPEALPERRSLRDAPAAFVRLPFDEAIRAFLARRIVDPEAFAAMSDAERLQAFTATRLASQQMVERAKALIDETLAQGGTLRDFVAQMHAAEISLGIEPSNPWYLETVYRSNVQSAYGQGRLEQLEAPEVLTARPFVQYRTAGDSRVRPRHAELDGIVFDRGDDDGWRRFAPPLGFNCRCAMVAVPARRVERGRIRSSGELTNLGPDPGWSSPGAL